MKKLLLLTIDFPPMQGGIARYLDAFSRHFKNRIIVITNKQQESDRFDGTAPYVIKRHTILSQFFWPKWIRSIFLLVRQKSLYDMVVVSHVLPLGTAACIAKLITKKPFVVIVHGKDIGLAKQKPIKNWITGQVLRSAKLVITNSKALAREVEKDFCVKKTQVVYPCFLLSDVGGQDATSRSGNRLLTVSRLVKRKGHLRVLQALALLRDKNRLGTISYDIVGCGIFEEQIEKEIERLKLNKIVNIYREVSDQDLPSFYKKADIFVMPTVFISDDREGFGIGYLEAGMYGLPSIATNQPGVDEAVIDNETGLLVTDGDISALADAISKLVQDRALAQQLGKAAEIRVKDEFTCEKQFSKLDEIL